MAAVRVPPSACRTSQSSAMLFSPSAARSMEARSDRPISRLISWVRPPILPLTDSRSLRVWVARGSIEYSAVTQPSPEPRRQRGTPSVTLAAHSTRVRPNSTSTERSEEHTSELQSRQYLVCRLLLEKKKNRHY